MTVGKGVLCQPRRQDGAVIVSDLAHDIRYQQTRNLRSNVNASGWNEKLLRQNSGREEGFFS